MIKRGIYFCILCLQLLAVSERHAESLGRGTQRLHICRSQRQLAYCRTCDCRTHVKTGCYGLALIKALLYKNWCALLFNNQLHACVALNALSGFKRGMYADRDLGDPREAIVDGTANQAQHPDKNKDASLATQYQAAVTPDLGAKAATGAGAFLLSIAPFM